MDFYKQSIYNKEVIMNYLENNIKLGNIITVIDKGIFKSEIIKDGPFLDMIGNNGKPGDITLLCRGSKGNKDFFIYLDFSELNKLKWYYL